ncbi:MAG: NAD(P)/FAD-dependent oxidoreductase [Mucinivorans sp.]
MYDIIVVGGGPAGMIAAGTAGSLGANVLLLEKMEKPARKLRITGKGRCNITNTADTERFISKIRAGGEFVSSAYKAFDNRATIGFLEEIGLPLTIERGERVFPQSGRAQDVANAIENWISKQNVAIRCNVQVKDIIANKSNACSVVAASGEVIECHAVILATGGVSYPSTGSDGDGHEIADALGHEIIPLRPALVPLSTNESLDTLAGLELRNVEVTLMSDGKAIDSRFGELTFYKNAISGPTVIALSRMAVDAIINNKKVSLLVDTKPALTQLKIANRIKREMDLIPDAPIKVLLDKLLPRPLHYKILSATGISRKTVVKELIDTEIETLTKALKGVTFRIIDYRPFAEAIVTAGGVSTKEIDPETMQSKIVKNIFFAGELMDIDADTGGYNIQLAISTGHLSGVSAVKYVMEGK